MSELVGRHAERVSNGSDPPAPRCDGGPVAMAPEVAFQRRSGLGTVHAAASSLGVV
jgi:hypothetical protein